MWFSLILIIIRKLLSQRSRSGDIWTGSATLPVTEAAGQISRKLRCREKAGKLLWDVSAQSLPVLVTPHLPTSFPAPAQLFLCSRDGDCTHEYTGMGIAPPLYAFDVIPKKALPTPVSERLIPLFSSKHFIVLDLTSSFSIHLELIWGLPCKEGGLTSI